MKSRGELNVRSLKVAPEAIMEREKFVSEMLGNELVERAPDKMIQVQGSYLLFAWRNDLIVVNIGGQGIVEELENDVKANFTEIVLQRNEIQFLKLRQKYKIVTL